MGEHENATDVVGIVILRVELGRGEMNRPIVGVVVLYFMSLRNQIDIVHHDVVNLYFVLEKFTPLKLPLYQAYTKIQHLLALHD